MKYFGLYDDCGSRSSFYRLKNRRSGFKDFDSKDHAEFAHKVQSKLSSYNLAPKVYSDVGRIIVPSGYEAGQTELSGWGYVTEVARTLPECYDEDCSNEECYESACANGRIIDKILYRLYEVGIEYADGHRGNFGYVRRNKKWIPVVIDVGVESFSDIDDSLYGTEHCFMENTYV